MPRASRMHRADEFGKPTRGSIRGFDAPTIGSPTNVTIDGIVERESGRTPSPWSLSVTAIVIILVAMVIAGFILALFLQVGPVQTELGVSFGPPN